MLLESLANHKPLSASSACCKAPDLQNQVLDKRCLAGASGSTRPKPWACWPRSFGSSLLHNTLNNRLPFEKRTLLLIPLFKKRSSKPNRSVCGAKTGELNLRGRCRDWNWLCRRECFRDAPRRLLLVEQECWARTNNKPIPHWSLAGQAETHNREGTHKCLWTQSSGRTTETARRHGFCTRPHLAQHSPGCLQFATRCCKAARDLIFWQKRQTVPASSLSVTALLKLS